MRYLALLIALAACRCNQPALPPFTPSTASAANGVILLTVTQAATFPFARLHIRITNLSASTLEFIPATLPWAGPYALGLEAFSSDGRPLQASWPIDDPPWAQPLSLPPGASLEGTYDLGWRLDDIDSALAHGAVRINWSFPADSESILASTGIGPRISGSITLSQVSLAPDAV